MTEVKRSEIAHRLLQSFTHEVKQLSAFTGFAHFSLIKATTGADFERDTLYPWLMLVAGWSDYEINLLLPDQTVYEYAKKQAEGNFPMLYQLVVVRLWSALEMHVDDISMHLINNLNGAPDRNFDKEFKVTFRDFMTMESERRAEILLEQIKRGLSVDQKIGVGRFEAILSALGIDGAVDRQVRAAIMELSEVRHAIVHRGGTADRKFLARCPKLGILGEPIAISREDFERYVVAATCYVAGVFRRILHTISDFEESKVEGKKNSVDSALIALSNILEKMNEGKAH